MCKNISNHKLFFMKFQCCGNSAGMLVSNKERQKLIWNLNKIFAIEKPTSICKDILNKMHVIVTKGYNIKLFLNLKSKYVIS